MKNDFLFQPAQPKDGETGEPKNEGDASTVFRFGKREELEEEEEEVDGDAEKVDAVPFTPIEFARKLSR